MKSAEDMLPRKLTAILMADVVGYSLLMGKDEPGTLANLKAHRKELIDPVIEMHHGRIVKLMGDAALVEFPSVLEAVACALEIQQGMAERNKNTPDSEQIKFRIGVNLCDVIVEGEDIHGDGVNITARLETLATPGGVCISGMVFDALGSKLPLKFKSLGEKSVKNIAEPVRVYNVEIRPGAILPKTGELENKNPKKWRFIVIATVIALAAGVGALLLVQLQAPEIEEASAKKIAILELDKPSIAVLPFANMSGDADQEYFSDGISEDIITDLSQLSNLGVIARNSSFAYKGTSVNIQDVANELGVRYVLEGSVRKSGDRIRVTAQLIDAISGHHLWAERYDRRLAEFFELQDEIRIKIVSALSIQLAGDEGKQLLRKETNSFEAYDQFLKGRRRYAEFTNEGVEQAKDLYSRAIELDPEFARAYGALGIALVRQVALVATDHIDEQLDQALSMAQQAVSIEATSPQAQWALGFVHMWREEYEQAVKAVQQSVTLFPNYADGWALLALINNQLGRGDQALRFIRKGMELNPGYSFDYPYNEGRAYYNLGEYEMVVEPLLNALERNENAVIPRLYLAASYVRLGRIEDAEWEITQAEVVNPAVSIANLEQIAPMADGEHRTRFLEDMRRAGLPE